MSIPQKARIIGASVVLIIVATSAWAQDGAKLKLWIDSTARDTFSCGGLAIRLTDYDRDDKWFGHVFQLLVRNIADSAVRYDPTAFAALLRDGTQQTFPSATELAERAINSWWGKHELKSPAKQEQKRAELHSRRDLIAEDILPGASSVKRIAFGGTTSGGLAIGGRGAEELKEYRASEVPLTLYCRGRRVGVVSKPLSE
jgi:hypothetical protein